jgi:hypothetical protein
MSESTLQKEILLLASKLGHRLFRCNTAQGWVGQSFRFSKKMKVEVYPGDVLIRKARPLHAGLVEGGSDLIGWHGTTGKFIAIETKEPGGHTEKERLIKQNNFIDAVNGSNGIAKMVSSTEEVVKLLS